MASSSTDKRTAGVAIGCVVVAVVCFFLLPPSSAPSSDGFRFLGRFHTLIIHLPIGVLLLVAFGELSTLSGRRRDAIDGVLPGALVFMIVAMLGTFVAGALLASGGGYPPRLVGIHRTLGLAGIIGMAAMVVAWPRSRAAYRTLLLVTVGVVAVGAHFGGSITHGETYLVRFAPAWLHAPPPPPPPAPPPVVGAQPLVFQDVVLPILVKRCGECHGDKKASDGLRLDSFAAVQKGSDEGTVVTTGDSAKSPLVKRMKLPAEDDEHMPPSPKAGPNADEIALIAWWVDRGASEKLLVADVLPPTGVRAVLEKK